MGVTRINDESSNALMKFSYQDTLYCLCFSVFLLVLSGCSMIPHNSEQVQHNESVQTKTQGTDAIGNPYLLNEKVYSENIQEDFKIGLTMMEKQQWEKAQHHWEKFTKEVPSSSGGFLNLGIALEKQNEFEAALKAYEAGIKANQQNLDLYNQSGQLMRRMGKFQAAKQHYQAGLAQWNDYAPIHLNLGILYEIYLGEPRKGLEHYQKYQQLLESPDKNVKKWIIDLERRIDQAQ